MIETMNRFFTTVGTIVTTSFIVFVLYTLFIMLCDKIEDLKYMYKYKHRFNKKSIAKCYCKDCVHQYEKCKNKYCRENDRYVADNWFCWHATLHKDDPDKENKND